MQTINGYTIRNVTISTTKSQNPIDGEMYYDTNTIEIYIALSGIWQKLAPFDEREFKRLKLIEDRKEKLEKLNERR